MIADKFYQKIIMYPPINPYKTFHITVGYIASTPIEIYVELSGNPKGIPVIYLHGGPGDHSDPEVRQLFNPHRYHIVQFDQRGCGQSRPLNHVRKNTTQLLIQDIEVIRKTLGVSKFVVSGGSWGTTLALAYAIKHPALALLLRGVYDLSKKPDEVLHNMYPDLDDKIHRLTRGRSSAQMMRSTKKLRYLNLINDASPMYVTTTPHKDSVKTQTTLTIVGNHYSDHHFFITKEWIYKNLHKIKCPVYIVQGRYDIITPPIMAYNICKKMKLCTVSFLNGGHTYHDLAEGLVQASDIISSRS
jgi:proline iminopeptidase